MVESKNQRQTAEKKPTVLIHTIYGMTFSSDFFKKYWRIIVCVIFISLLHITNRYLCLTRMQTKENLEKQVQVTSTRAMSAKGLYLANTREKSIKAKVDSLHLNLEVSKTPNVILKYSNYEK